MFDQPTQCGPGTLADFAQALRAQPDLVAALRAGLVGKGMMIDTPQGKKPLVYADYVASGRALVTVERFIYEQVLPFYANSHTEDSFCGATMTHLREAARQRILAQCGGTPRDHALIFCGAGATAALNKLVHLFGLRAAVQNGQPVQVLVGPYEHHSNLLPWREAGASVTEIDEGAEGGPDGAHLAKVLATMAPGTMIVAAFSAASNVTGLGADVVGLTRQVKAAGGRIVWDYAGGGPYLPIAMSPEGEGIDAIALSPHKFLGGPGASGVLILRRDAVRTTIPSAPGGGTVAYVNDHTHDYRDQIEEREEGGTPNALGDIRAGLVFEVKAALGQDFLTRRNADLMAHAAQVWGAHPRIRLLGGARIDRLPILSFVVDGAAFDYQRFTRDLSERYGIQARGGCACAGPYVHRLLQITPDRSAALREQILSGDTSHKPGFVRLNLSVLMTDEEVDFILNAVADLAAA